MKRPFLFLLISAVLVIVLGSGALWFVSRQTDEQISESGQEEEVTTQESDEQQRALDAYSCNDEQMFRPTSNEENQLQNIKLNISSSEDGVTFTDEEVFVVGAGVPSVTQGADRTLVAVFNWFTDYEENPECYNKVALMTSDDDGETWDGPFGMFVEDFPDGYQLPYDPTITTTEDGGYRLFFTTHLLGMGQPFIYGTAVSNDGLHYTYDGIAFESNSYDIVDGSEVRVGETWYMIAPVAKGDGKALQATSTDGRTFTLMESDRPEHSMYWVGNMTDVDGEIRFYGSCGIDSGEQGLCYSSTEDGTTWEDPVLTNGAPGDPAIVYTDEGIFILINAEAKTMTWPEESDSDNRNR